ncbi:MAG: permease-like cell division protein FtsX [Flavobacteriales bacterium]|jgi:cell division transport system permease protein|tara:strand:- start:33645 stop:34523 length:879 start_codon:yes stop_codon:yes gene_type:complete
MKQAQEKHIKRRLRTSSLSTVLSISMVLLMLGSMSFIYVNSQRLTKYIKENIGITVILNDNAKAVDVLQFQKNLDANPVTKMTTYVSKEEAASALTKELGEDFMQFLGHNPLSNTIDIFMNSAYAESVTIEALGQEALKNEIVKEVKYQKDLIDAINQNMNKLNLILICFCALLLIVSITLINNTIRLTVYSKRFIIRTMKLVGATNSFIRKPFVMTGLRQGVIAGLIGVLLMMLVLFAVQKEMPELLQLQDIQTVIIIFSLLFVFGILISTFVTHFSVNKYLKIKEEKLYH